MEGDPAEEEEREGDNTCVPASLADQMIAPIDR